MYIVHIKYIYGRVKLQKRVTCVTDASNCSERKKDTAIEIDELKRRVMTSFL